MPRKLGSVWWFGFGYFLFYVPYSALAKALSEGLLFGTEERLSGFAILPATVVGSLVSAPIVLGLSGLWRNASTRNIAGWNIPFPRRDTLVSATCAALIVGATTLNYTFEGISILFALLLMRGGVLVLCPFIDFVNGRRVGWYSWLALMLSLTAVAIALLQVPRYGLTLIAGANLAVYLFGYAGRFSIMARNAKTDNVHATRRYFVEEHMSTMPILLGLVMLSALVVPGEVGASLRFGFQSFLWTKAALPALGIGVLYELLFVFGTLIYLDRHAYSYCVPINRGSSLVAGLAASGLLSLMWGHPPPSLLSLVALGLVGVALLVLAIAPKRELQQLRARTGKVSIGTIVFVCAANTKRSPIAAALCRQEIGRRLGVPVERLSSLGVCIVSAGLSPRVHAPMFRVAQRALRALGITDVAHGARSLDAELVQSSQAVFCMTEAQRRSILAVFPDAKNKVWCLNREGDIEEPAGTTVADYVDYAMYVRPMIRHLCVNTLGVQPIARN